MFFAFCILMQCAILNVVRCWRNRAMMQRVISGVWEYCSTQCLLGMCALSTVMQAIVNDVQYNLRGQMKSFHMLEVLLKYVFFLMFQVHSFCQWTRRYSWRGLSSDWQWKVLSDRRLLELCLSRGQGMSGTSVGRQHCAFHSIQLLYDNSFQSKYFVPSTMHLML